MLLNKARGESGQQQRESLLEVRPPEWLETVARALGPLRPIRLRRFERAKELIEMLGRVSTEHARFLDLVRQNEGTSVAEIDSVSQALEDFDPDRGASGRPRALSEYVPGTTAISGSRKQLRNESHGKTFGSWIRLDRDHFELGDSQGSRVYRFPIDNPGQPTGDRRTAKGVAELVWFEALVPLSPLYTRIFRERVLLLLDNQGFRLAIVENLPFTPEEVLQLARAAGVPAAAYRVRCMDGQTEEILKLMFPRRKRVKRV